MRFNFVVVALTLITLLLHSGSSFAAERFAPEERLRTEVSFTENGVLLTVALVDGGAASLSFSPTPLGWHSRATFGSTGEVLRLHRPDGVQLLSGSITRCEALVDMPLLLAAQERLAKLSLDQLNEDQLNEDLDSLWSDYLLGQLVSAALTQCSDSPLIPESGYCSIQPTYAGCHTCCSIEERINSILVRGCTGAAGASASVVGGPIGAAVGGTVGYTICDLLLSETTCHTRCEGKDGDSTPIDCLVPGDPDEFGVCRQLCEDPSHDQGPSSCPSVLGLTCCAYEFDEPDETLCPPTICPGVACPPSCGGN